MFYVPVVPVPASGSVGSNRCCTGAGERYDSEEMREEMATL
jgi:hypothetical protein